MTKEEMNCAITKYCADSSIQVIGHEVVRTFLWGLILDGRSERSCEECGNTFPVVRKDQKFCKGECKIAAHNTKRKVKDAGKDYEE